MCVGQRRSSSSSAREEEGLRIKRERVRKEEVGVSEIDIAGEGRGLNLKLIIQWYISNKKREKKAGRAN